jgi:enterochelin esterase family protein
MNPIGKGVPVSPRLAALKAAIESGDEAAPAAFWREIEAQGTPMVEPIEGDEQHVLLTSLWRDDGEVRHVLSISTLDQRDYEDCNRSLRGSGLVRLGDSNVFYKTHRVSNDARFVYRLSPNDSLVPYGEVTDWDARRATWQHDPLNPNRFVYPQDDEGLVFSEEEIWSVVELPAAPPQPWSTPRPGVPTGQVRLQRLRSDILDNERRVWVYTPPGYTSDGAPCGLLLLFDGWQYVHLIPTPTILDNLLAEGLLPPLVAVLIDNPDPAQRLRDLHCYPPFVAFLAHELLAWVHRQYHVTSDPARTIVGGLSAGGDGALFAALRHPELFGNALSQDGAFPWSPDGDDEPEWLARQFAASERLPLRFYLEASRLEPPCATNAPGNLTANRHLRTILASKGYPLTYNEYTGDHSQLCWRGTLGAALIALIGADH